MTNGYLYIAYYGGSGEYGEDTAVYGSRLQMGKTQWTEPKIIADTPDRGEGNPVVWQGPDVGVHRCEILLTAANEPDGLAFNDWIPVDAATWTALDAVKRRTRPRSS